MLLLMMMMIDSSAINPDSKYRQRLPTRKRFYSPESFHCPSLPTHRHDACENESRVSGSDAATDATVGCSMPLLVLLTHSRTNPSKRSWLSRLSFPVFVSLSLSLFSLRQSLVVLVAVGVALVVLRCLGFWLKARFWILAVLEARRSRVTVHQHQQRRVDSQAH